MRANYHKEEDITIIVIEQIKSFKVTIGSPGASGCDYLFASAADQTEQSLELINLFPALNRGMSLMLVCTENCNTTVTWDYGTTAGGNELAAGELNDDLNDVHEKGLGLAAGAAANIAVRSIFLNATPGANWDTMISGKWTFYFVYFDYTEVE